MILPVILRDELRPVVRLERKFRNVVLPEPEEPSTATNCPGIMVPDMLSRMTFALVGSPYSQKRTFFLCGIVLTVRFSKVSCIFFLVEALNVFLCL